MPRKTKKPPAPPTLRECKNPRHERVHPGEPRAFTQSGRGAPRKYCDQKCSDYVETHYLVSNDGEYILKRRVFTTTPIDLPLEWGPVQGETRSYAEAKMQTGRTARKAGIPKGSPIRTALLEERDEAVTSSLDVPRTFDSDSSYGMRAITNDQYSGTAFEANDAEPGVTAIEGGGSGLGTGMDNFAARPPRPALPPYRNQLAEAVKRLPEDVQDALAQRVGGRPSLAAIDLTYRHSQGIGWALLERYYPDIAHIVEVRHEVRVREASQKAAAERMRHANTYRGSDRERVLAPRGFLRKFLRACHLAKGPVQ